MLLGGFFVGLRDLVLVSQGTLRTLEGPVLFKRSCFYQRGLCVNNLSLLCHLLACRFFSLLALRSASGKKQVSSGSRLETYPGVGGQVVSLLVRK